MLTRLPARSRSRESERARGEPVVSPPLPAATHLRHPHAPGALHHRCHRLPHRHRSASGFPWEQKEVSQIMFFFSCQCGREGPRDDDEDLLTLYLIINPSDPSDVINVSVPWPFCHLIVRVVVVSETRAATPILRCAHRSVAREMDMQERVLALPQFALSNTTVMPTRAVYTTTCGCHKIYLGFYKP